MSPKKKIADLLRRFLDNSVEPWEFDDFLSSEHADPNVENYKREIAKIPQSFPANDVNHYASAEGIDRIRAIADELDDYDDCALKS